MLRPMVVLVFSGAVAVAAAAPVPPPPPASEVVATVGGEPFTLADLEKAAGPKLFQIRSQQYEAQRDVIEETISDRLLEREAAARKVSVDELLRQEVDAKLTPTAEAEVALLYEQ